MNVCKVLGKGLFGLVSGVIASIVANPEAVTSLAGQKNTIVIGAIVALANSLVNYFKHKDD